MGPQSWQQKKARAAAAADMVGDDAEKTAVDTDMHPVRGVVGWRDSNKSFIIWYKKADGQRSQTQKGLLVKTTKKTGAGEVPLNRKEFLAEKRKMFVNAVQKWNEWDCSKRPRLSVPCRDDE